MENEIKQFNPEDVMENVKKRIKAEEGNDMKIEQVDKVNNLIDSKYWIITFTCENLNFKRELYIPFEDFEKLTNAIQKFLINNDVRCYIDGIKE